MSATTLRKFIRCLNRDPAKVRVREILASPTFDESKRINFANFVRRELPIHIAHRARDLDRVPVFCDTRGARIISTWYQKSFSELIQVDEINTLSDTDRFGKLLSSILDRHSTTNEMVARGVTEYSEKIGQLQDVTVDPLQLHLQTFFEGRATLRAMMRRCIEGKRLAQPESVENIIQDAVEDAELVYDEWAWKNHDGPKIITVQGCNEFGDLSCVRPHVQFVLFEIVKNALRAAKSKVDVSVGMDSNAAVAVRVSDDGAGMCSETRAQAMAYGYSTAPPPHHHATDPPLCGLGFGLPASRTLVRFSGGDLRIESVPGCGTDVHIHFTPIVA